MTQSEPGDDVIRNAVMLACRAPSLHNTQPWRWTFDGAGLHLFADRMRVVLSTDSTGREVLLSCGAVLDHLRVAMAAAGWDTTIERFPDPHDPDHVAVLRFTPMSIVTDAQCERADAILARRTDRLPFDAPPEWPSMEVRLRLAVIPYHVMTDIVLDRDRPILAEASRLTEQLRSCDPSYQSELDWWTSPFALTDGIPQSSLVSDSEAGRVDVARTFPSARPTERRPDIGVDRSKIIVLSTSHEDARCRRIALWRSVVRCVAGMHPRGIGDVHIDAHDGSRTEPRHHPTAHGADRLAAASDQNRHRAVRSATGARHAAPSSHRGPRVTPVALLRR